MNFLVLGPLRSVLDPNEPPVMGIGDTACEIGNRPLLHLVQELRMNGGLPLFLHTSSWHAVQYQGR